MKTYIKKETQNKLKISYCDYSESPRKWDNLGYIVNLHNPSNSPDDIDQELIDLPSEYANDNLTDYIDY